MENYIKISNLMYGHNNEDVTVNIDEKLTNLAAYLATMEYCDDISVTPIKLTTKILTSTSKKFLASKLNLYDVLFASDEMIKSSLKGKKIYDHLELANLYNSTALLISPFDIPIKYVNQNYYHGLLSLQNPQIYEEDFLKEIKLLISRIELSKKKSDFSCLCYIHEIMHSQLVRFKGSISDYLNDDVLSIFIELVFAYENNQNNLLKKDFLIRINHFLIEFEILYNYYYENNGNISDIDATVTSKYIISTLKAFKLFDQYISGSDTEKTFIMSKIQEVFDAKKTLEEILVELDITYENSLDKNLFIKQLII
ncbi:MAG: hypothetical protein J1F35_06900 [Erysipelotrichales bacterium]|nr:hypothetical protein [Erysipelotrichales bacterium]